MSDEFLEGVIPCKDCLVRAACTDLKRTNDDLREILSRYRQTCLLAPQPNPSEKNYRKSLLECSANFGYRMINRVSDGDKKEDPIFIHPKMAVLIKELIYLTQWVINSTSWTESKIYEFDQFEIDHKLKLIQSIVKGMRPSSSAGQSD